MQAKAVRIHLCALLVTASLLPATGYAESRHGVIDPAFLFFEAGPGDWRPLDATSTIAASATAPGPVVPLVFIDDDGKFVVTPVAIAKEGEFLLEGACNGGQCSAGGRALNCPTSGGPTCSAGQTCSCQCESGGGETTTHNQCSG